MAEVELDLGEEERRQLVDAALRAIKEEEPAAKATLMHQLIRLIGEPDRAVQGILRDAGVFGVARDVITGLTGLTGLTSHTLHSNRGRRRAHRDGYASGSASVKRIKSAARKK